VCVDGGVETPFLLNAAFPVGRFAVTEAETRRDAAELGVNRRRVPDRDR